MEKIRRRIGPGFRKARRTLGIKAATDDRNVVITGPGRSGTTLTCHLLNKLPDTVALSEPVAPGKFADRLPDHEAVCDGIEDFYRDQRRMALQQGMVVSKHVGGVVPDNTKGMKDGVRQRIAEKGKIEVGKELGPDFYLAIKDVGMFTALLPTLAKRFRCFAIVRNPLAIRASSLSVQSHRKGRRNPPARVRYDTEMGRRLDDAADAGADPVDKWLLRMHLNFERYRDALPDGHVIRYEDIVATGGRALGVILPAARELDEPLQSKNLNSLYEREKIVRYGERMLESDGAYWDFYSREDVEEILNGLT